MVDSVHKFFDGYRIATTTVCENMYRRDSWQWQIDPQKWMNRSGIQKIRSRNVVCDILTHCNYMGNPNFVAVWSLKKFLTVLPSKLSTMYLQYLTMFAGCSLCDQWLVLFRWENRPTEVHDVNGPRCPGSQEMLLAEPWLDGQVISMYCIN